MERYKDHPSAYSLNFAASVLPKLRNVLQHPNSDYIDVGLHTLEVLVANFGNTIRQGANANASAIGGNLITNSLGAIPLWLKGNISVNRNFEKVFPC
jgi:hypothetical protein